MMRCKDALMMPAWAETPYTARTTCCYSTGTQTGQHDALIHRSPSHMQSSNKGSVAYVLAVSSLHCGCVKVCRILRCNRSQHESMTSMTPTLYLLLHICCLPSCSPALLHNIATAIAAAAAEPAAAGRSSGYSRVWSRDPTVVVLADVDKSQMDVAVQEAVR